MEAREALSKSVLNKLAQGMLKLFNRSLAMLGSNLSAEFMPKASAIGVEVEGHAAGIFDLPFATIRQIPRFWGRKHQDAQEFSDRSISERNLTNVYATYAGPKHFN